MARAAMRRAAFGIAALASLLALTSASSERERNFPELYQFPYHGRGDPMLSFHHPFEPDEDGDPVQGWVQLGTATVTQDTHGREMVRLTTTAQANQGLFYAYTKTRNNDFNGWFDVQINTAPDSHEPADGMGLFFTSQRPVVGSAMGMSHTLQGLGLIIDTFSNSRTRMTPYLYAYVSDGVKAWNPDTDGADTELAKGCHIELNKPVRIYVSFVDGKLNVGVSMNPHGAADHWHSCFTVDHVSLPFSDGGYLSFVGETGHFFAAHDVHGASFLAEHSHQQRVEERYERERREREDRERREHEDHQRREREDRERRERDSSYHEQNAHNNDEREREDRERREREDREWREREERDRRERQERERHQRHADGSATGALSGNLDRQVSEVFASISDHMKGFSDRDAEDTKNRLIGVRDMVTHILHEVARQRSEVQRVVDTLGHLKESANSLHYATNKFKTQLATMHKSIDTLRSRTHEMSATHNSLQERLEDHHEAMYEHVHSAKGDSGFFILFGVVQLIFIAGAIVMNKMSAGARKVGRMV